MTKTLSICCLALLAGCTMSNDEIIAETTKCQKAGLTAKTLVSGFTYAVRRVQCVPKESK